MAVDKIFDELGKMSVLELVELKNKIEEEWGVTAAAPVAVAAPDLRALRGPVLAPARQRARQPVDEGDTVGGRALAVRAALRSPRRDGMADGADHASVSRLR